MRNAALFVALILLIAGLSACENDAVQPSDLETDGDMPAFVESSTQEEYEPIDYIAILEPDSEIVERRQFEIIGEFVDGVARIRGPSGFGLIDIDGNVLAEPVNSSISIFVDGVAVVQRAYRRFGLMDTSGNFVAEPIYDFIFEVIDGYAVVRQNGRSGIMSVDGSWVLEPSTSYSLRLQPGGVVVFAVEGGEHACMWSGMSFGLMDVSGNVIVEPIYTSISDFFDNVAVVSLRESFGYWYEGLMYIDGNWVLEPVPRALLTPPTRGLVAFNFDGNWGFMNTQGEVVIEAQYALIGYAFFREFGLALHREMRENPREYIVVFDIFGQYLGFPSIHTDPNIAIFQYRVIDLVGNTVFADENIYKISGASAGAVNTVNIMEMGARVQDGVNYYPVIVTDNTQTIMFDPNGFYAVDVRDGYLLVIGAEPIEVILLDENLQFEWVPIHSN